MFSAIKTSNEKKKKKTSNEATLEEFLFTVCLLKEKVIKAKFSMDDVVTLYLNVTVL